MRRGTAKGTMGLDGLDARQAGPRGHERVVRVLRFLAPMRLSVLTQHRVERPFGVAGGAPGAPGRQHVERADGRRIDLGPIDGVDLEPGDRFVIETPGGGGWGRPVPDDPPPKRTAPVR